MKIISVIGSGTMGNGIAHSFSLAGFRVNLIDISEEALKKALKTIEQNLDRQLLKESITKIQRDAALKNIEIFTDIRKAVKDSD